MNVDEFRDELVQKHAPTEQQQGTVDRLLDLYERSGLLPGGRDEPLYDTCRNAEVCWEDAPRPSAEHAGISVPWVGRDYAEWRICVIGLNFHNYGGLAAHWRICASHVKAMQAGGQGKNGRFFATGAMSYARAIELSISRQLADGWETPSPADLAETWEHCAYLQAVKCAPAGNRSRPTDAMCSNCPPFLLAGELEILAPSAVILLGRTTLRDIVRPMLPVRWVESPGHFERDEFSLLDGAGAELFSCNHPSTNNRAFWRSSLSEMVDSLRCRGVGEARQGA